MNVLNIESLIVIMFISSKLPSGLTGNFFFWPTLSATTICLLPPFNLMPHGYTLQVALSRFDLINLSNLTHIINLSWVRLACQIELNNSIWPLVSFGCWVKKFLTLFLFCLCFRYFIIFSRALEIKNFYHSYIVLINLLFLIYYHN